MPNIVTRSEWGARSPGGITSLPLSRVERLFIHYSGMASDFEADHARCYDRVRGIQNYHMDHNGWDDIAYSWVVCIHGAIFEGRGLGRRTAATGPCNDDSYAACLLGNDRENRRDVTPEARDAFAWLIADLERRKGVRVSVEDARLGIRGHRDCMSTSCPGDELYALIRSGDIREQKEEDMATPEETWGYEFPYAGANVRAQTYLGRAYAHAKLANERAERLESAVAALAAKVDELEQPAQVSAAAIVDEFVRRLSS